MKWYLFFPLLSFVSCTHHNQNHLPLIAIQIEDRNGLTETVSSPERISAYEKLNYLSSQPYKKVLRVFRENGKSESKITTYHPNGTICQYLEIKEMRAHGAYKEWYPNGQLKIDAQVIGGTADLSETAQKDWLFNEISQVWDETGNLIAQIPYEKGVINGTALYFFPNGKVEKETSFVDDLLHGQSLEYHPNGKLRSTASFQKGIKEGISQGFFSDGRMAWQEEYHQGLLCDGLYFNTNGDQIAAVESKKGMQARFNGDAICRIVEIKRGIQEGKVNRFNDQGELIGTYFIRNGKKQGEEIEYFLNSEIEEDNLYEKSLKNYKIDQEGSQYHNRVSQNSAHSLPKLSVCWDQDAIHGTVKTWYSNGKMQSQREYCRNQKQGTSLAWYKNGSLMLVEEYEQGMLTKGSYYKKNQNEPISTIVNGNGTAYLYDEEGIFLRKITYIKNKPIDPED